MTLEDHAYGVEDHAYGASRLPKTTVLQSTNRITTIPFTTHPSLENRCVKCSGLAPGYANAYLPSRNKSANAPPRAGLTPAVALGGMGTAGIG